MASASTVVAVEATQALPATNYLAPSDVNDHAKVTRAIKRCQRHAAHSYRMPQPDTAPSFTGRANGVLDQAALADCASRYRRSGYCLSGAFT